MTFTETNPTTLDNVVPGERVVRAGNQNGFGVVFE